MRQRCQDLHPGWTFKQWTLQSGKAWRKSQAAYSTSARFHAMSHTELSLALLQASTWCSSATAGSWTPTANLSTTSANVSLPAPAAAWSQPPRSQSSPRPQPSCCWHTSDPSPAADDALRPAILHAVGGLYLDNDVDCLSSVDTSLAGASLVLQAETFAGTMLTNAMLASRPAHPFWLELLKLMAQRQQLVRSRHLRDGNLILNSTGPYAISELLQSLISSKSAYLPGEHSPQGTTCRVFPVGAWFQPCQCTDVQCHHEIMVAALEGRSKPYVVGHHHCTATWWTAHKAANRRRLWNSIAALCFGGSAILGLLSVGSYVHASCLRGAKWRTSNRPLLHV